MKKGESDRDKTQTRESLPRVEARGLLSLRPIHGAFKTNQQFEEMRCSVAISDRPWSVPRNRSRLHATGFWPARTSTQRGTTIVTGRLDVFEQEAQGWALLPQNEEHLL